ncbi:MAG: long-chain fatty acid--CoA ligase [Leptospiraceae bacterium]|nr:long-chain fatty acid--CoA ligase [Leptospiraceae bacterium]
MQIKNMAELYRYSKDQHGKRPAFARKRGNGPYETISYDRLYQEAREVAAGLYERGIRKGDRVGIFADNRYEWILSSVAITLLGAADVPRGADITTEEIEYIVSHSEMKLLIVENNATLEKVKQSGVALPEAGLLTMESVEGYTSVDELRESGKKLLANNSEILDSIIASIKKDDLFTLIYTSGTTGKPKGVMLNHGNLISQVEGLPFKIEPGERVVSILPVWHIFERGFEIMTIYCGACTYYSNIRTLRDDLRMVRPTFMASAPRLWESIYAGIMTNVAKAPAVRQKLFGAALFFAGLVGRSKRYLLGRNLRLSGSNIAYPLLAPLHLIRLILVWLPYKLLDIIVLKKIRQATGGELRGSVSGGGALPPHVDAFFNNIGIPVLEGYGLTETSPVLAVRTFNKLVPGSVGPIYRATEIRIKDLNTGEIVWSNEGNPGGKGQGTLGRKGEIHVRGPQVTSGYFKNKEATDKVIDSEGWFNTGDLGMVTANQCLKIVGRSKETIVLLGGENVEPGPIENRLLQSPLIQHCMVVGQDQKYLGALIVPEPAALSHLGETIAEISAHPEARPAIQKEIKSLINEASGFKGFERVVDFQLLDKAFDPGDELTAKLSVKRHVVTDRYQHLIDSMYGAGKRSESKKAVAK